MLHLSSWDWVSDRVVESLLYQVHGGSTPPPVRHDPEAERVAEAVRCSQVAFNSLCRRANTLILEDLRCGYNVVDAVDSIFGDEEWIEYMQELQRLQPLLPPRSAHAETLGERFPWANLPISPPARAAAERCLRMLNAVSSAHEKLTKADVRIPASTPVATQNEEHLWFLADPAVPRELRRGMLAHRRGAVALAATYPSTSPRVIAEDFRMVRRLIDFTTESMAEYLGVLANIPEAAVTIVPPDGSDLEPPKFDVFAPFRAAVTMAGDGDVREPL